MSTNETARQIIEEALQISQDRDAKNELNFQDLANGDNPREAAFGTLCQAISKPFDNWVVGQNFNLIANGFQLFISAKMAALIMAHNDAHKDPGQKHLQIDLTTFMQVFSASIERDLLAFCGEINRIKDERP